jgi:cytochrome bd-type quinol oxidase subunit 2
MSMNMVKKFWNVILISSAIFGTLFFGAIFSLIGGAVAQKKGEQPQQVADNF